MNDLRPNTTATADADHETKPRRPLMDRKQASQYFKENHGPVTVARLHRLAVKGEGPPYRLFARRALYEPDDLDEWWAAVLVSKKKATSHAANPENAGAVAMAIARRALAQRRAAAKATPAVEPKPKPKPRASRANADATA
jgi:hypothetical protein